MKAKMFWVLLLCLLYLGTATSPAQRTVEYPYPVKYIELTLEKTPAQMAYMDVSPVRPNGQSVILFHGKNFNGFYWKDVIPMLTSAGFRVVVPDQIGWGRSSKPNIHYSFHLLAANSKKLLDSLDLKRTHVVGHSMGGMLAVRFSLMYPDAVGNLVLENPIGLEDYRAFVPYQSTEELVRLELGATYESYKNYQRTYYPVWKTEYEQYVAAQAEPLGKPDFADTAFVNAITSQMIYEQPVVYEFKDIRAPTLLIIGQEDRTVVGRNRLPKDLQNKYGNYPELGRKANREIRNSKLVELPGVGHIPHIQVPEQFRSLLIEFLGPK